MLFTWKVPFAVCESVAPVKFQEYGIPKEHIAYVTSVLMSPGLREPWRSGTAVGLWRSGSACRWTPRRNVWVGNIDTIKIYIWTP